MEQIHKGEGEGGELAAEIFETWFPKNPIGQAEYLIGLIDKSGADTLTMVIPYSEGVIISKVTKEYLQKIIEELRKFNGNS